VGEIGDAVSPSTLGADARTKTAIILSREVKRAPTLQVAMSAWPGALLWRTASLPKLVNYATHGIADPLGVTFALGGTPVNAAMIYVLLPMLERAQRNRTVLGSLQWRSN